MSALLGREFICAWVNTRPELPATHFGIIPPDAMDWRRNFPQGTGNTNVTMFFCSSDGRVLSHLEGFWAPAAFVREARYVLQARDRLTVRGVEVPENAALEGVRDMHRQAIADYRYEGGLGWREPGESPVPMHERPRPPWDEEGRRRPHPIDNAFLQLIRFHEFELSNPLRRVDGALTERLPIIQTGG